MGQEIENIELPSKISIRYGNIPTSNLDNTTSHVYDSNIVS